MVGVGGNQPIAVPRYNSDNKWVGYWSSDTKENSAGAIGVNYSDTSIDEPDPVVAHAEYDRYLSQLEAKYLKAVAVEVKGDYVEGKNQPEFYDYVKNQNPAASIVTAYSMRWIYLSFALLLIILTYLPNLVLLSKLVIRKYSNPLKLVSNSSFRLLTRTENDNAKPSTSHTLQHDSRVKS